ncbi:GntR family transcriptional regulator [Zhihengliuella somnathii]
MAGPVTDVHFAVIDPESEIHPYQQLKRQIAEAIRDSRLVTGQRLPPVRRLAADLGLATNTVARVYKELEAERLVETRGRAGTVVAERQETAEVELARAAEEYARTALKWAQAPEAAAARVRAVMERLQH